MKTTIGGIVTGCIILLMVIGCGKKPEDAHRPSRIIVFFGDSVTYGYSVDQQTESFYALINKIMKSGIYGDMSTVNAGVIGDDTTEALSRIATDVNAIDPDFVVIAFGLNDCQNNSLTPQKFKENINDMIAAIPSKAKIFLATSNSFLETGQPPWDDLNDSLEPYMKEIRNIAVGNGLGLIDVHSAWKDYLARNQRYMETFYVDPTHPSVKGHRFIYEIYMNALRKTLMK